MAEIAQPGALSSGRLEQAFDRVPAAALLVGAMIAFQVGGALGVWVLPAFGALGTAWVRTAISGVLLCLVARPRIRTLERRTVAVVVVLGLVLAGSNAAFYLAVARIPIGAVVTVAFVGPLAVALFGSRRPKDFAWVALAAAGVALFGGLPGGAALAPAGLAFAALDGILWGAYAILAKRIGTMIPSSQGLTLATLVAAVALLPFVPSGFNASALSPKVVAAMVGVGLFTAIPYLLEFAALQRMATATYGVLVSLEPALATIIGIVMLGQQPTPAEAAAVVLVVVASVGASRSAGAAVAADVGDP
jgi:inner membrane transporter RhtA